MPKLIGLRNNLSNTTARIHHNTLIRVLPIYLRRAVKFIHRCSEDEFDPEEFQDEYRLEETGERIVVT